MANKIDTDDPQFISYPSQMVNIWWLLILIFSIYQVWVNNLSWWLITPAAVIYGAKWLIIRCWSFTYNEKTISERKGVLSVLTREIHYYRIKSVRWEQPFFLRIFGLSNVVLVTSDPLIPIFRIYGVENGSQVIKYVKEQVSIWRRERSVKEQDIHPLM
jgi:uncharacterized membrane protein YdbT with pleckstrin-like domain